MSVHLYAEPSGRSLFLGWFLELPRRAQDGLLVRLELLEREGYALGAPVVRAGPDDLRELVLRFRGLELCVPFFFHGRATAVVSHGRREGSDAGWRDTEWLLQRRAAHRQAPSRLTFELVFGEAGTSARVRSAARVLRHLVQGDEGARGAALGRAREALELSLELARAREAAGVARDDLAARLGVAVGALDELEEGDAHALSCAFLRRVAAELGLRLELGLARRTEDPFAGPDLFRAPAMVGVERLDTAFQEAAATRGPGTL